MILWNVFQKFDVNDNDAMSYGILGTRMEKVHAVCGETEHQHQYNSFVKTIYKRAT